MIYRNEIAVATARLLLQIKAIKLNTHEPFTWASGWKSPIYCDNRVILSYPEIRTYVKEQLSDLVKEKFPETELLAGVATAGIAIGALAADALETPFCYVRSSAKEHGLQNRIEGLALPNQKTVVVEDLISTGGSSIAAVESLRIAKCNVLGLVAIFTYGFATADNNFTNAGCTFFTLTDYSTLLNEALQHKYILSDEIETLKNWRVKPETWGK